MTPRGHVTLLDAGGKLFVTDGVVYAAAVSPPAGNLAAAASAPLTSATPTTWSC